MEKKKLTMVQNNPDIDTKKVSTTPAPPSPTKKSVGIKRRIYSIYAFTCTQKSSQKRGSLSTKRSII